MIARRCRRRLLSSVAAAAALSLVSPAPVVAQEAPDEAPPETSAGDQEARAHFESGRLFFDRGEYERALAAFETAYELSRRPGLLYNIYLTLERLGRYGDAADRLEQFITDGEAALDAERRAGLETRIANLRERARNDAPPDDGPPAGGLSGLGIAGATTLGVGGATLLAFAIVGGLAVGEDSSVAARCGADAGRTCTEADVSTLRTLTTTADVLLGVGLVLAAAGGAMLAIDLATGDGESTERVTLSPMIGPGVAGITAGGSL